LPSRGRSARLVLGRRCTGHPEPERPGSRAALVADIITQMRHDLAANPTAWTNHNLDEYLYGLAETLRGMDTTFARIPGSTLTSRPGSGSPKQSSWPADTENPTQPRHQVNHHPSPRQTSAGTRQLELEEMTLPAMASIS
jgi:hypothetical protein